MIPGLLGHLLLAILFQGAKRTSLQMLKWKAIDVIFQAGNIPSFNSNKDY
jgi:hypothetical protein